MDKVDKQILRTLAANSRTSLKALAGKVGLAAPSTSDRLKRLEERGQIARHSPQQILRRLERQLQSPLRRA